MCVIEERDRLPAQRLDFKVVQSYRKQLFGTLRADRNPRHLYIIYGRRFSWTLRRNTLATTRTG
jgi:hypothetical protein